MNPAHDQAGLKKMEFMGGMNETSDLLKERFKKFQAMEGMGIYPFGGRFLKEGMVADILKGFEENKKVATEGGSIAGSARGQIEKRTGKKILTKLNAKGLGLLGNSKKINTK